MKSARSWDIFCTVVDNYGDIGVCWRLARQLAAEHGQRVRLWVDDIDSFRRICPRIGTGVARQSCEGVEICAWREPFPLVAPADIVVEAFACNPPANYVAAMAALRVKPVWINLEYLSAEDWVRGCHGLPSPHPSLPLNKYFFFPGFVEGTGGLLGEAGLAGRRDAFQCSADARASFWQTLGLRQPHAGERQISVFCYPQNALAGLLRAWADGGMPLRCLVPEGVATDALCGFFDVSAAPAGSVLRSGNLEAAVFPFLDQDGYDRMLWTCDLNFVRGEDSFVRGQWAARPMIWQVYPQAERAHWPKLRAFQELREQGLPEAARQAASRLWQAWNEADAGAAGAAWSGYSACWPEFERQALGWAGRLATRGNLANSLAQFTENLLK
jgi:uncharacterized repeat protein (TIGR03837 family)